MGDIHVEELFGIGKRYDIRCSRGQRVSVVVHKDGVRDFYAFESEDDEPTAIIRMEENEARKVGAILSGTYFSDSDG